MKLIRSYLELDMYAGLTVHTESTIAAGEAELQTFGNILRVHLYRLNITSLHSLAHQFIYSGISSCPSG